MLLFILSPVLVVLACLPKYRRRISARLGFGLLVGKSLPKRPRVWIHALSVGEAASSKPLLQVIRKQRADVSIVFSTTTRGGAQYAEQMTDLIDLHVPFPFDLGWVVVKFIKTIDPDLFILTETDLWPNFLWQLSRREIPSMLINGRITQKSFGRYKLAKCLFLPLFNTFSTVSMQMEADAYRMKALGVKEDKVVPCGNLKYDLGLTLKGVIKLAEKLDLPIPPEALVFVLGSTHPGEDEVLLRACAKLRQVHENLFIIIAPRDISRGAEVLGIAVKHGLVGSLRTDKGLVCESVLVLDTLGELAAVYALADLSFVGGSLVAAGGHNPLEPAVFGKPVLFGEHMEDFAEIADDLLEINGAGLVSVDNFIRVAGELLADSDLRQCIGGNSAALLEKHQGAAERYLALIEGYLPHV